MRNDNGSPRATHQRNMFQRRAKPMTLAAVTALGLLCGMARTSHAAGSCLVEWYTGNDGELETGDAYLTSTFEGLPPVKYGIGNMMNMPECNTNTPQSSFATQLDFYVTSIREAGCTHPIILAHGGDRAAMIQRGSTATLPDGVSVVRLTCRRNENATKRVAVDPLNPKGPTRDADPKWVPSSRYIPTTDLFTKLAADGTMTKVDFFTCGCNVRTTEANAAKLGACSGQTTINHIMAIDDVPGMFTFSPAGTGAWLHVLTSTGLAAKTIKPSYYWQLLTMQIYEDHPLAEQLVSEEFARTPDVDGQTKPTMEKPAFNVAGTWRPITRAGGGGMNLVFGAGSAKTMPVSSRDVRGD